MTPNRNDSHQSRFLTYMLTVVCASCPLYSRTQAKETAETSPFSWQREKREWWNYTMDHKVSADKLHTSLKFTFQKPAK